MFSLAINNLTGKHICFSKHFVTRQQITEIALCYVYNFSDYICGLPGNIDRLWMGVETSLSRWSKYVSNVPTCI